METMIGNTSLGLFFKGDLSGLQQTLSQAEGSIDRFGNKTTGTLRGVNKEAKDTGMSMERLAAGIKGAFVGGSVAVGLITLKNQIVAATGAIVEAQVQVDRLRNGFKFGTGSAEGGARELQYVREEAKRLGLELNGTANQYMKMVAASRGGAMAGQQTRDIFQAIAEATVVMGMGVDQSERSFMAVTQMMSKGKVMAEELRGQLGEHLPGAFSIAARAMGVTEVELNKMLETGQVFSADFLPKFAAQLRKELAGSVEESALAMQANINRMSTAWQRFKQEVAEGGVGGALNNGVRAITNDVTVLGETLEMSRKRGEGFWLTVGNAAGVTVGRATFGAIEQSAEFLNGTINLLSGGLTNFSTQIDLMPANLKPASAQLQDLNEKAAAAEKELQRLQALDAQPMNGNYFKGSIQKVQEYIQGLRTARGELQALMGKSGDGAAGSVASGDTLLARAQRADYDKRLAARNAVLKEYATPKEKLSAELDKQRKLLGDLFTPDLEKRITEHFIKPSKGAAKEAEKAAKAFDVLYNKLTAKDVGLDPDFYKDLNTLHKGYADGKITLDEYRGAVDALVSSQKFAKDAADAALKANIAAGESNNAAFDEYFNAQEKERLAVEARIKVGRTALEDLQFETSLLGLNTVEREQATAMRELERQGVVKGTEAYKAYAEEIQKAIADKQARQEMLQFWEQVEGTAQSVFMDIAMNGEDAFKRIGESIKREVIQMLYEMTIKKWIIQVSGSYGGAMGGTGNNWLDMAQQAYSAYTSYGSTAAVSAGAGTVNTTTLAGVSSASAGSTGVAGGSTAAASSGAAAGGSTSLAAYAGYAALIWAAVQYADKLYGEGYNRNMLGKGVAERRTWGYGNRTSGYTDNAGYSGSPYDTNRKLLEGMGMSEKWADILSSTTRYAHMFGRKLNGYGYAVNINGGDVSVGGYESYRAGWAGRALGRKTKEMPVDIDQRNAQEVQQQVKAVQEGAKLMAQAMGYSGEAIDAYTGKLKINFKGANTAAEQAERMAEAMDDLQYSMLRAASGGKMARAEFDQMMEGVRQSIADAGISTSGIADILASGIVDGAGAAAIGQQLSQMILGGIYTTMAQQAFAPVAQAMTAQIITPIFTAMAAGVPLSQAISQAAINNVVATAQQAAVALNAVFSSAEFRTAISGISSAISGVASAAGSVKVPKFKAPAIKAPNTAANDAARERAQLEKELLRLQGKTVELRRRELLELHPANRALQKQIWLLEDQKDAAEKLKDTWGSVMDAITEEMKSLRDEILGSTDAGRSYALAEFTTATAAARAGDLAAAERLPELARAVVDMATETAASLSDLRAAQGFAYGSLEQTRQMLKATYGIDIPAFAAGGMHSGGLRLVGEVGAEIEATGPARYWSADQTRQMLNGAGSDEVVAELRAVRQELKDIKGLQVAQAAEIGRLQRGMAQVSNGYNVIRTQEVGA